MVGSGLCWFLEFFHDGLVKSLNRWSRWWREVAGAVLRCFCCQCFSFENPEVNLISFVESLVAALLRKLGHKSFLCQVGAWSFDASSP